MRLRQTAIAILCAACGFGCSNPDNLVVGGILGSGSVPDATITVVGSSISDLITVTDIHGNQTQLTVILMSDLVNLCETLTSNPDFFQTPTSEFTVLAMTMPGGMLGTFYAGSTGVTAGLFAAAGIGAQVYGYPGVSGTIVLSEFDTLGEGTFDLEFIDDADNQYEVYGNFQTTPCAALENAVIPQISLSSLE